MIPHGTPYKNESISWLVSVKAFGSWMKEKASLMIKRRRISKDGLPIIWSPTARLDLWDILSYISEFDLAERR